MLATDVASIATSKKRHPEQHCNFRVFCKVLWNGSTPCQTSAAHMDLFGEFTAWALNDVNQSVAQVLTPIYSRNSHGIFSEEKTLCEQLLKGHHNIDTTWYIPFKMDGTDVRDTRPLCYPGRMVFSTTLEATKTSMWWNCAMRRARRTEEVQQLKSHLMKEVENLAEESLPETTAMKHCTVKGPRKFSQIGPEAASAVLTATLDGADFNECRAICLIDTQVDVADFFHGFLK